MSDNQDQTTAPNPQETGLSALETRDQPALGWVAAAASARVKELEHELATLKAATKRAKAKSTALEASMPAQPRDFSKPPKPLEPAKLREALEGVEKLELAFVGEDGTEMPLMPPRELAAMEWEERAGKLRPKIPSLQLHGPGVGLPPYRLAGYALIADGKVIATAQRPDVIPLGAGSTVELKDDIAF